MIQSVSLNIQCLKVRIYFTFYLKESLFHQIAYNEEETDFSLGDLCNYATVDLYKYYRYKKFTGLITQGFSTLRLNYTIKHRFSFIEMNHEIDYSDDFPLDLELPQNVFCNHLFLTIILSFDRGLDSSSLLSACIARSSGLRACSKNYFWAYFPDKLELLESMLDEKVRWFEAACSIKGIARVNKERLFKHVIDYTEKLYDDCKEFLRRYDEITSQCARIMRHSRTRKLDVLNNASFGLQNLANPYSYIYYLLAMFDHVQINDLRICNNVSTGFLRDQYYKFARNNEDFYSYSGRLVNTMLQLKEVAINRLNDILQKT